MRERERSRKKPHQMRKKIEERELREKNKG